MGKASKADKPLTSCHLPTLAPLLKLLSTSTKQGLLATAYEVSQ